MCVCVCKDKEWNATKWSGNGINDALMSYSFSIYNPYDCVSDTKIFVLGLVWDEVHSLAAHPTTQSGCSPDHVLVVHLREQFHLPGDPVHHLATTADRDALDGI